MPRARTLLVALAVLLGARATLAWMPLTAQPGHGDENGWIAAGHDAFRLLSEGDLSETSWTNPRWGPFGAPTPLIGKLVIGASVALHGRGAEARAFLPEGPRFDWDVVRRLEPSPGLLAAGRWPMPWLTALAATAFFVLLRRLGAPTALALLASALLVLRPLVLESGRLAMIDMTTLAGTLVCLALMSSALVAGGGRWRRVVIGAACGLTAATKLIGGLAFGVCVLWSALAHLDPRRSSATSPAVRLRAWLGEVLWLGGSATAVFFAAQPLLWHGPYEHLRRILGQARRVSRFQVRPERRFDDLGERWSSLTHFGLDSSEPFAAWLGIPFLGAALCAAGAIALVASALRRGSAPPVSASPTAALERDTGARLALVWLGLVTLATLALVPFDWRRWYLAMEPCWALLQALGLYAGLTLAYRSIPRVGGQTPTA